MIKYLFSFELTEVNKRLRYNNKNDTIFNLEMNL